MPKLGVILQARLGSTRLPGKVLQPIAGIPMIDHALTRLRRIHRAQTLIVATGDGASDSPLVRHINDLGVAVFRGSEADVLDRYYRCAETFDLDPIVRATGDNPFVDPEEGERLIDYFQAGGFDYAAAVTDLGSELPVGAGLEIMSRAALETSWRRGTAPHHREHVNEYVLENRGQFRCGCPPTPAAKRGLRLRLTVDTADDLRRANELAEAYAAGHGGDVTGLTTEWAIAVLQGTA